MKKLVYVSLSLLLILALTSCDIGQISIQFDDVILKNPSLNVGFSDGEASESSLDTDKSDDTSEKDQTLKENESSLGTDNSDDTSEEDQASSEGESSSDTDQSNDTSEEDQAPNEGESSEDTAKTEDTREENQTWDESDNAETLGNVNNGILKDASTGTMNVPENMKLLGSENATAENNFVNITATVVLYTLDGNVVNWFTENDLIYVITSGNNRLVIIDTKTMLPIANVPLSGNPAEMNIVEDKIYISFPDLYRIDVFLKSSAEKEYSLYFDHEVSSFCLDGDYIYYSEHDQHCGVFRKNLVTNEITMLQNNSNNTFYYPKLYLNKEDRILYIGETNSSGCGIYYFDADTLTQKSMFLKGDYGITNHTREIFHIGDEIFWGNYRLSDTNAKELEGRYGTANYGSVVFASSEIVSTYEGLFLTDTYECIVNYFNAGFDFEHIVVTESNNVFFRKRSINKNIIIGVNFNLQ